MDFVRQTETSDMTRSPGLGPTLHDPNAFKAATSWPSSYFLAMTALLAGLAAASVEMMLVLPIQAVLLHTSPSRVFQYIAVGVDGRSALSGGAWTVAQGVFLHTVISVAAAGIFVFVAGLRCTSLRASIALSLIFGALAYFGMIFIVLPCSKIGFTPPSANALTLVSFGIHLFAFGLPMGLVTSARLRPA